MAEAVFLDGSQMRALISDDFSGAGPTSVAEDIPAADLAHTAMVPAALTLMRKLEAEGAKLTATGRLNRKFVESLVGRIDWPGQSADEVWRLNKVVTRTITFLRLFSTRCSRSPVWLPSGRTG